MDFNFKRIKRKFDFVALFVLWCWVLYTIGYNYQMQEICKDHDSKLYFYIKHDFRTVKNWNPFEKAKHHCLQEIQVLACFAGQKQILYQEKCKVNEQLGENYGYY
jgi:hypothetical protein